MTDNGGPFRSFRFEAFIATHPELRHVRTRVRTPGQNGSRERGFGSLKYERLFLEEIDDVLDLVAHAEDYRVEYNTVRPHEAIAWNRPHRGPHRPRRPAGAQLSRAREPASYLTRDTGAQGAGGPSGLSLCRVFGSVGGKVQLSTTAGAEVTLVAAAKCVCLSAYGRGFAAAASGPPGDRTSKE